MDAEDSLILQNQIRENSDELQNFLRDMDHWEKEMKQKEAELKLINSSDEQECPPIRNSLSRNKRNRHKKNRDKSNSNTTKESDAENKVRISSYNYNAWDKFDVETELKKIDGEEKKESSASDTSDNEEEEEMSIQSKRQLAIIKKDNGNKFFKAGSYDSAINCYTLGMELDPENALLPANRAMAFLKKEQFQAAENDCTVCLYIDPTYVKAYLRRGAARLALKKFSLAKSDFLKALEIEPENKQAQLELEKIDAEMCMEPNNWTEEEMEAQQEVSKNNSTIEVMEIQEAEPAATNSGNFARLDVANEEDDDFSVVIPSIAPTVAPSKSEVDKSIKQIDKMLNGTKLKSNDSCRDIEDVVLDLEKTLPPVPTASYQFLTDWKKISKYPELQYSYLKQIPPGTIQALFKHYIEPELFPEILHTLSTLFIENGDDVYHYMKSLTTVGRFSTMLMFLSQSEKEDLQKLKSYLEMSGYDPSEVNAMLRLYKVV